MRNGLVTVEMDDSILGDDVRLNQDVTLPDYKVPVQIAQGTARSGASTGARSATPSTPTPSNPTTPQRETAPSPNRTNPVNTSLESRIALQNAGQSTGLMLSDDEVLDTTHLWLAQRYGFSI